MSSFKKATKTQQKLRLLVEGVSGSGKTYSSLVLAASLGKKIAVIDTEKGSASLYAGKFNFDVCELSPPYTPERYIETIKEAEKSGYDVIVIDSITHEWSGQGGCLDIHTQLGGKFQDWGKVSPRHNKFIEAMLQSKSHIIATARAKADYEMSKENGKTKVEKVGLKTEQREGLDFEFSIVFRLNSNHLATSTKDRTTIFDNTDEVITEDTGKKILAWLQDGEEVEEKINKDQAEVFQKTLGTDRVKQIMTENSIQKLGDMPVKLFDQIMDVFYTEQQAHNDEGVQEEYPTGDMQEI